MEQTDGTKQIHLTVDIGHPNESWYRIIEDVPENRAKLDELFQEKKQ